MTQTPRRWSGTELPEELDAALSSAGADSSEQAIERLRARLSDALGPSFGDATQPLAAAQTQPTGHVLQLLTPGKWLGIGALFAIGFGVFWIGGPGAPAGHEGARTGAGAVHGALPGAVELSEPQPMAAATDAVGQRPAVYGQPPTAVANEADPVVRVPQPTAVEPAARAAAAPIKHARSKPTVQEQPKPAQLGLAEELRQLEQIRQRLRISPARALVEADTHARRFPEGTLGPERELLRVDALLRLGRNAEAHKLAERMLAAPEGHPYRAQIEKLLAAP